MSRYRVKIQFVGVLEEVVEADSELEAIALAKAQASGESYIPMFFLDPGDGDQNIRVEEMTTE